MELIVPNNGIMFEMMFFQKSEDIGLMLPIKGPVACEVEKRLAKIFFGSTLDDKRDE
jgi:hypothetical protein